MQIFTVGAGLAGDGALIVGAQARCRCRPMMLLNDRQTIGSYPRLGALTPLALANLAQCLPGARVRFRPVLLALAWGQQRQYLARFKT